MTPIKEAAADFMAGRRIAVAGVSRQTGGQHGGNIVYGRLKEKGYDVFPVNPNATEVEGDPCFPNIAAIPGGVDGVVIATAPDVSPQVMQEVIDLGIKRAWMHCSVGKGSVSPEATKLGRDNGVVVIDGGCPLMYGDVSDGFHRFFGAVLRLTGGVPKRI